MCNKFLIILSLFSTMRWAGFCSLSLAPCFQRCHTQSDDKKKVYRNTLVEDLYETAGLFKVFHNEIQRAEDLGFGAVFILLSMKA